MSAKDRQFQVQNDGRDPRKIAAAFDNLNSLLVPTPTVKITAGDESANVRNFTIFVQDRLQQNWEGRWLLLVHITPTLDGDPSATGNTVAFGGSSFVLSTLIVGAAYIVLTNANGNAQMALTIAGAATRHVYAQVLGKPIGSGPLTWT